MVLITIVQGCHAALLSVLMSCVGCVESDSIFRVYNPFQGAIVSHLEGLSAYRASIHAPMGSGPKLNKAHATYDLNPACKYPHQLGRHRDKYKTRALGQQV